MHKVSVLLVDCMHHIASCVGVYVYMCVLRIPHVLGICMNSALVLLIVDAAQGLGMHESSGPRSGVQKGVQK